MKKVVDILNKYLMYIGIGVIALSLLLLIIPQFFRYDAHVYNAYQAIFYDENIWNNASNPHSSVGGIIALVLLVLAVPLYVFVKKSSAAHLFGGILVSVSSLLFFFMKLWFDIIYRGRHAYDILWLNYFVAALLLILGAITIYTAVLRLLEEKKAPVTKSSYSYIRKK